MSNGPGHPNTLAALVTTGLAYVIYRITQHYDWLHLSSGTSLLAAGGVISGVLFIGRKGIWPTLKSVWFGASRSISGPTADPTQLPPVVTPPPAPQTPQA